MTAACVRDDKDTAQTWPDPLTAHVARDKVRAAIGGAVTPAVILHMGAKVPHNAVLSSMFLMQHLGAEPVDPSHDDKSVLGSDDFAHADLLAGERQPIRLFRDLSQSPVLKGYALTLRRIA